MARKPKSAKRARSRRPAAFSVTKAVKHNARALLGQPPSARVLPGRSAEKQEQAPRHRATLARTLARWDEAE